MVARSVSTLQAPSSRVCGPPARRGCCRAPAPMIRTSSRRPPPLLGVVRRDVSCCTAVRCVAWCCVALRCVALRCLASYCPYYVMFSLCYAILCYVMLRRVMLYHCIVSWPAQPVSRQPACAHDAVRVYPLRLIIVPLDASEASSLPN